MDDLDDYCHNKILDDETENGFTDDNQQSYLKETRKFYKSVSK